MTKKRLLIAVGLIVVSVLAAWYLFLHESSSARSYRLARAAAERVHVGMARADAESALSDALLHKAQPWGVWTEHLFFYGSLSVQDTTALAVHTNEKEGQEVVTAVYLVPRYSLCGEYGICSDTELAQTPDN